MPRVVSRGPGAPIPTPAAEFPAAAATEERTSFAMRSSTASAPRSASVGSDTSPRISDPSSATVPTTRFVPPMSTPMT